MFAGLEWEEIESSEGPALLSLQPSAPNGQVSLPQCAYAVVLALVCHTGSILYITTPAKKILVHSCICAMPELQQCMQAHAPSAQQLPMPMPPAAASLTNVHLRPQLDQYEDMARFLGYSSSTASQATSQHDRSNRSQRSLHSDLPSASTSQPPAAPQAAPFSHKGLYPNDHAMDLPATTPFRASSQAAAVASVSATPNPWEGLQRRASSSTSTSSSSTSHHSHQNQQQPNRQFQTPITRVAASPFMADAEHSFVPLAFAPSPFMADAEHSFIPTPVQDPPRTSWEPFGSPTLPQTDTHSNSHDSSAQPQQAAPVYNGNNASNGASPPTNYFSYLDLLGPGQSANPQTVSQQQFLLQHQQHRQHQHHRSHGQGRHQHHQDRQQINKHNQQHQHQHQQDWQQHRRDREQQRQQHQSDRSQHQAQLQQQARELPGRQASFSQSPTGTNSDPLPVPAVNSHSAFDSFDESPGGESLLTKSVQ